MMSTVYSMSSTCPCCGKQACPVGLGVAAVIGGVLASIGNVISNPGKYTEYLRHIRLCFRGIKGTQSDSLSTPISLKHPLDK
jgi:hypothetical protein